MTNTTSFSADIVPENIRAAGTIYFASMLEQLKLFGVMDLLIAHFQQGLLAIGQSSTARGLYLYWREASSRLTAEDRTNIYARTFGLPGGTEDVVVNREFNDLWVRFIAAVSGLERQNRIDNSDKVQAGIQAQADIWVAARDLAANLSLYGSGIAYFAAAELRKQVEQIVRLLSDPEIQSGYGARDMWQLIDQVATTHLGGSVNVNRYRTMATSGNTIIAWLAKNTRKLQRSSTAGLLGRSKVRKAHTDPLRVRTISSPTDADLINACEQWLAVAGISDDVVDNYAQPGND